MSGPPTMATTSGSVNKQQQVDKISNDINLLDMIESRITEIIQIEDECRKKLPKLFHQRLPRFMRRRAACHNNKRLPRKLRPSANSKSDFGTKSRKSLLKYRRKIRFRKHKRILKKHARHRYNDPFKCLLHKWFAKRFKLCHEGALNYVPLKNNTKNYRNLRNQTLYGCAYLSLAHLIPVQLDLVEPTRVDEFNCQISALNKLTKQDAGFTFNATSLKNGRYEIIVHLFRTDAPQGEQHLCEAIVNLSIGTTDCKSHMTLSVPRYQYQEVCNYLEFISKECTKEFDIRQIYPRDWTRIRLVGPKARDEALKVARNKEVHELAIKDVRMKLNDSLGVTIGRYIEEEVANFTYYNSRPQMVDIVFKGPSGRLLWHQLIKNKAHLVGGFNDIIPLVAAGCTSLISESIFCKEIMKNYNAME